MLDPGRALILDKRCTTAIPVCRALASQGCQVDVFASPGSPVSRPRYCVGFYSAPPISQRERFLDGLQTVARSAQYDQIYIGSEELLEMVMPLSRDESWQGLLLPPFSTVDILLSKHRTIG